MNKKLLYKYFQGIASTEEEKHILNWVEESDENRALFLKERMLFDIALFSSKPAKKRSTLFSNQIFKWGMRSAAIFIFALLSYFSLKDYQYSRVAQMQTVTVPPGQRAQITLADGTKVWLNSQSTMYDATNIRLREISFGYILPKQLFKTLPIKTAKIGFVARNLFMIYSKTKGFDPEGGYSTASSAIGAEYCSMPTMRSIGVNVNLTF